jgi:hypothetical protein
MDRDKAVIDDFRYDSGALPLLPQLRGPSAEYRVESMHGTYIP